jgi:putative nucleotidyltransferase with HDIG domain
MVRGFHEGRAPWAIWLAEYRWLWPYYGVFGALALVTALAEVAFGWVGILALMAPVGMMHLSIKQYMDHTSGYMTELRHMNNRLKDSYEATLQALTRALDTRDEETEEHSQRVKQYTLLIGRQLNVPPAELEDMSRGALLHDIGKIGVPDAILLKPGRLTEEERVLMRKHPEIGYRMIAHIPFLTRPAQIVLHHHEMFDGSGYPAGLSGASIPLGARIFAVADTFDAMTSDRPYRKARSIEFALNEIKRCSGTQFDPEVVAAILQVPRPDLEAVAVDNVAKVDRSLPFLTDKLYLTAS